MRKKLLVWILLAAMAFLVYGCDTQNGGNTDGQVSVLFINAGRADSALILAYNKAWLIDTGTDASFENISLAIEKLGIKEIEGVFFTHTHSDHTGGFARIAAAYDIKAIYCSSIYKDNNINDNVFINLSEDFSITLNQIKTARKITLGTKAYLETLGPLEYNTSDDNDNSLVMRFTANGKRFLFAGDMQFPEETSLMEAETDLKADVLKVGNHGNPDATQRSFAEAVSPEIVVIPTDTSVDDNSANPRVLELFQNSQIHITQNYAIGVMVAVSKDGKITVSDFK